MNRLEADRRNLAGLAQAAAGRVCELLQAQPHGRRVIGHARRPFRPLAADVGVGLALVGADPLNAAARKLAFVGHVEQPILEARRAQVGH